VLLAANRWSPLRWSGASRGTLGWWPGPWSGSLSGLVFLRCRPCISTAPRAGSGVVAPLFSPTRLREEPMNGRDPSAASVPCSLCGTRSRMARQKRLPRISSSIDTRMTTRAIRSQTGSGCAVWRLLSAWRRMPTRWFAVFTANRAFAGMPSRQQEALHGRSASRSRRASSNKGMKQTKPSILELRSLSPVLDGPSEARGC
jgi:hypothetical protein